MTKNSKPKWDWYQVWESLSTNHSASVDKFIHVPYRHVLDNDLVGSKAAFLYDTNGNQVWIVRIVRVEGYKILVTFLPQLNHPKDLVWTNIAEGCLYPIGWSNKQEKFFLEPPAHIRAIFAREPHKWNSDVISKLKAEEDGQIIPILTWQRPDIVLKMRHRPNSSTSDDNYSNQESDREVVSQNSVGYESNHSWCQSKCCWDPPLLDSGNANLRVGMKLEAIDPFYPSNICVATVIEVSQNGDFKIKVDSDRAEDSALENCFLRHLTSLNVFYCGFSAENGLELQPPFDFTGRRFSWDFYFSRTGYQAVPRKLFTKGFPVNKVQVHDFIEVIDLMNPNLLCPAIVIDQKGILLRVHFLGWTEHYDQWMHRSSGDIFPAGWAEMAKKPLQPPGEQIPEEKYRLMIQGKRLMNDLESTPLLPTLNGCPKVADFMDQVNPGIWNSGHVVQFLKNNGLGTCSNTFEKFNGEQFMSLKKTDLNILLSGNKQIAAKIVQLINQLKLIVYAKKLK